MGWLRKRFGEASTYNGLALLSTLGATIFPQHAAWIIPLAGALAGTGIAVPEAKRY